MFADLDVVLFDLQDVGSRSYTYISTMGLAMQTAAATDTEFVVLDRPNPLGGEAVDGFMLERASNPSSGSIRCQTVHGLTVGEVALLIEQEQWMPGLDGLRLRRDPGRRLGRGARAGTSSISLDRSQPRLPTADSALLYNGMVLLAGTSISDGSGT